MQIGAHFFHLTVSNKATSLDMTIPQGS